MITYPLLKKDSTIGVTAPSSGVPQELHDMVKQSIIKMESKGYSVKC